MSGRRPAFLFCPNNPPEFSGDLTKHSNVRCFILRHSGIVTQTPPSVLQGYPPIFSDPSLRTDLCLKFLTVWREVTSGGTQIGLSRSIAAIEYRCCGTYVSTLHYKDDADLLHHREGLLNAGIVAE